MQRSCLSAKREAMDSNTAAAANRIAHGGGRITSISANRFLDAEEFQSESEEEASGNEEEGEDVGSKDDENPPGFQGESSSAPQVLPPERLTTQRPQKKAKPNPGPRVLVDEMQMVQLVKAYRVEFALFCRGRKQAPKQMIPKKVWTEIYHSHFLPMFSAARFEEDTLKKHLREQLAELSTGVADDGERPLLQDEQIASEVRATDCFATRNILWLRRGLVDGVTVSVGPSSGTIDSSSGAQGPSPGARGPSPGARGPSPGATTSVPVMTAARATASAGQSAPAGQTPPTQSTSATISSSGVGSRPTKADVLYRQADAVCEMAKKFQDSSEKQSLIMDKQGLMMDAKRAKSKLAVLREARDEGFIDADEYKERLKELLNA